MTQHVREAFLSDAKDGYLYLIAKAPQAIGQIKRNADAAALLEVLDHTRDSQGEACLAEQRGMQQIRSAAYARGAKRCKILCLTDEFLQGFVLIADKTVRRVKFQLSTASSCAVSRADRGPGAAFFLLHIFQLIGYLAECGLRLVARGHILVERIYAGESPRSR